MYSKIWISQIEVTVTEQGFFFVKVPGMSRIPSANKSFRAIHALGAIGGSIAPESMKPVFPYIHKVVCSDIALHQFFSVFDIQTGTDIAIASHAGDKNACAAQEIMVSYQSFLLNSEEMRASECNIHITVRVKPLLPNKRKQMGKLIRS